MRSRLRHLPRSLANASLRVRIMAAAAILVMVTSAVMGVQSIGTGILAELIVRTHIESQHKTTYAIAGRVGFPPSG